MNHPTDAIVIRPADLQNDTDGKAVARMIDDYAADAFGDGRRLPHPVINALPNGLRDTPGARAWLVEDDGQPVGVAVCFVGFSTFSGTKKLNIHDFSVNPSHRRRGLGRRLMRTILEAARVEGCGKVTLEVRHDNTAAQALYRTAGFAAGDPPYAFWTCEIGD